MNIMSDIENEIFLGIKIDKKLYAKKYNKSLNDINNLIQTLIDDKKIIYKNENYIPFLTYEFMEYNNKDLFEDIIWKKYINPKISDANENCKIIMEYAFTEILNNAIDHSNSEKIKVTFSYNEIGYIIFIDDYGTGIFEKIRKSFNLENKKLSIFELFKGKVTTDSENHSGEGIFFSSKVCNRFDICSDDLVFSSYREDGYIRDDYFHNKKSGEGSLIVMRFLKDTDKNLKDIMDSFTDKNTLAFNKTIIPLKVLELSDGNNLVSRSQAKRLLSGLDKFTNIILDFNGIDDIQQGFADEVFRVFINKNPKITIKTTNTNTSIDDMIKRVQSTNILN